MNDILRVGEVVQPLKVRLPTKKYRNDILNFSRKTNSCLALTLNPESTIHTHAHENTMHTCTHTHGNH